MFAKCIEKHSLCWDSSLLSVHWLDLIGCYYEKALERRFYKKVKHRLKTIIQSEVTIATDTRLTYHQTKVMPITVWNFNLRKSECRYGIELRYGWEPKHLQVICPGGINFSISHGLHCTNIAYTQMRLNANTSASAKQLMGEAAMMYFSSRLYWVSKEDS